MIKAAQLPDVRERLSTEGAVMVGGTGNFAADTVTTNTANYDSHGRTYRVGVRFKM